MQTQTEEMSVRQNKIFQPEQITVKRSQINFAAYNPRLISDEARKKLKKNMQNIGLLGGIVWNETTGNLVSGHQRVAIMDSVNRYDPETGKNDYEFRVEVVHLDEKTEKEQNLFMNNRNVQGEYDDDMLRKLLVDIDYENAGFEDMDLQILGLADVGDYQIDFDDNEEPTDTATEQAPAKAESKDWSKENVVGERADLAAHDELTKGGEENHKIDRTNDFYSDSEANQIARHNEIQKIKDRIASQNDANKDGGVLSYFVVSFPTPSEKMAFLHSVGFDPMAKYINGNEFISKLDEYDPEDEYESDPDIDEE